MSPIGASTDHTIDTEEEYLMIFDNVEDIDLVRRYFPRSDRGSILITTRNSVMSKEGFPNYALVSEFTAREGYEFLEKNLPSRSYRNGRKALKEIVALTGGLPIALNQVAAFMRSRDCGTWDFLERYHSRRRTPKRRDTGPADGLALDAIWELCMSALTPKALQLLDILAFLDPDNIPYKLLAGGFVGESELQDDLSDLEEALGSLRQQSLIRTNPDDGSLAIHRLFRDSAFHRLDEDKVRKKAAFEKAVGLLFRMQPHDDRQKHWRPECWEPTLAYLPHVKAIEARFKQDPIAFRGSETRLAEVLFNSAK
jgi:NB-ARC domain